MSQHSLGSLVVGTIVLDDKNDKGEMAETAEKTTTKESDQTEQKKDSPLNMNVVVGVLAVLTTGFMVATFAQIEGRRTSALPSPDAQSSATIAHAPRNGTNRCEGKKPKHASVDEDGVGDYYFSNVDCMIDGLAQSLEQAGGDVTLGYKGDFDAGDRVPITTPYFEAGLCPVNVHWHLGAEHRSEGEFDEDGSGPYDIHALRRLAGKVRLGSQCHHFNEKDSKFNTPFDWKHCVDMEVGQTYEVHWPHSAAGACGTVDQYQTPFYDGVFCNDGIISLDPLNTYMKIGVQAQIFTIVNDEEFYYPNLFGGMIVDPDASMGVEITKYTGSTTGTTRSNEICSRYTPITWQVDRKCHMISASSFDKMCADMKAQKDDLSEDLYAHGSREHTADEITANNHQNRFLRS